MEDSDYFILKDYVEQFAKAGPLPKEPAVSSPPVDLTSHDNPADNSGCVAMVLEDDPTNGVDLDSPDSERVNICVKNWKAAATDEKKKTWDIFDKTGIFAAVCRHSFILWVIDMVQSGEL